MGYKRICVSLDEKEYDFVKKRCLNPSRMLRRAISEMEDGTSKEVLYLKITKYIDLFNAARDFIDVRGLRSEWEKTLKN